MESNAKTTKTTSPNHDLIVRCSLGDTIVSIPQEDSRNSKYITQRNHKIEICNSEMTKTILVIMDPCLDDSLFMKLVNNIKGMYDFIEILEILELGNKFFEHLELTQTTLSRIHLWINRLGRSSYIWNNLTNKPDYNMELYKKRFYPFYNIKSKEWKEIANDARRSENYPPTHTNIFEKGKEDGKDFTFEEDVSQKHNNFMSYPVLNPSDYGNIQEHLRCLYILYSLGLKNEAMEAFLRICLMPSCCHITKLPETWKLVNLLIGDALAMDIVMYVMYYSQYILRHESTKMFSQVRRSYRVIYTYSELYAQPDTEKMHIERDPYIQQLSDDTFISQTIPFHLRERRPINSKQVFERRLFLATGGSLVGIDFKKLKASLSGSILIPCVTKSPLEERFKDMHIDPIRNVGRYIRTHDPNYYHLTDNDRDFLAYLEYYYPSYDSLKDNEYIREVLTKKKKLMEFNMKKFIEMKESDPDPNRKEIKLPEYNKLADMDISLTTSTFDEFRMKAMTLFKQIKENTKFRGPVWITEIETLASFKFKIYGPGLVRPIDLFRIPYDAAKMVKKFHVPCVRMWFEGKQSVTINQDKKIVIDDDNLSADNMNIYDSCVRALKGGTNNSYKWFSCNKIPADVILKYAQRGITTILNKKERNALKTYILISQRWKNLMDIKGGSLNSNLMDIFGVMTTHHKFFYPSNFDSGIRMNLRNTLFPEDNSFYSKRQSVNYPEHRTVYGGNLAIKNNTSTNPPRIENINKYISYCKDDDWEGDKNE